MTEKAEKQTYEQKLISTIEELGKLIEKSAKEYQQYIGALDMAKYAYNEYMKEINGVESKEAPIEEEVKPKKK